MTFKHHQATLLTYLVFTDTPSSGRERGRDPGFHKGEDETPPPYFIPPTENMIFASNGTLWPYLGYNLGSIIMLS